MKKKQKEEQIQVKKDAPEQISTIYIFIYFVLEASKSDSSAEDVKSVSLDVPKKSKQP